MTAGICFARLPPVDDDDFDETVEIGTLLQDHLGHNPVQAANWQQVIQTNSHLPHPSRVGFLSALTTFGQRHAVLVELGFEPFAVVAAASVRSLGVNWVDQQRRLPQAEACPERHPP